MPYDKRLISQGPRIVGKPLDGQEGTPQKQRGELTKREIQEALRKLIAASNAAQMQLETLTESAESTSGTGSNIHPFLTIGS